MQAINRARMPRFLATRARPRAWLVAFLVAGVGFLAVAAQLRIALPLSPVPITGQTFGVLALALLFGARHAPLAVASYLAVGAAGLPVFAGAAAGLSLGPTTGYLGGMLVASVVVGLMADRGWAQSFGRALVAGSVGTVVILGVGLLGLSFFVPAERVLALGLLPFLPGGAIKCVAAAAVATWAPKNREGE